MVGDDVEELSFSSSLGQEAQANYFLVLGDVWITKVKGL